METLTYGITKSVVSLDKSERNRLLELMTLYYDGVSREQFNTDLDEKEAIMMMLDSRTDDIVGFSTFLILNLEVENRIIKGFFSGDTVVHADYRKTTTMGVEIGKNFISTLQRFPRHPVYWILISKGCRTYRIMPIFFLDWFPRHDRATPLDIKNIMDAFGQIKYPLNYDKEAGLITFSGPAEALRPGVAEAHEGRLQDPHIRYFVERNPGHMQGDELVCAAEISIQNFAPAFKRMLRMAGVKINA